jgi:pilus assembly protein CpaC
VLVQANLLALRSLYERLLPGSQIDVIDNDGTIALTGRSPTSPPREQATRLASGYGNKVLNLLEVAGGQQVMLQVRFAEVSKTATSALGVNLGYTDGKSFGASNIGHGQPVRHFRRPRRRSDLGITARAPPSRSSAARWSAITALSATS